MKKCDALYFCDYLVTQNDDREVIENAALATVGNRIAAVGTRKEIIAEWEAEKIRDLGPAVILPGLMNAHTHVAMSFLRGRADDKPLMEWLTQDIFPIEAQLTPEIIRTASEFSCAEMIRSGTTCFFDMYPYEDAVYKAADNMGMRAVMGESVCLFPTASYATPEEALQKVRKQALMWRNHPRIQGAVVPHAIYTNSPELLQECKQIADEAGWVFGMHLSETALETGQCLEKWGKRPVQYCSDLGLLSDRSTFFHMVDVNGDDLDLIAQSCSSIVHNPVSNMKLSSGIAPVGMMLERNINVGLGSDGPASNNAQNMFREMLVSALLQKVDTLNATALPAGTALDMATLGSARSMCLEDVGCLCPGARADFIALDLKAPNMQPLYNIISQLVYAASGMETCLTVIDGEVLYEQGRFTRCDYEGLLNEMQAIRSWVFSRK